MQNFASTLSLLGELDLRHAVFLCTSLGAMFRRVFDFGLAAMLLIGLASGCKKAESNETQAPNPATNNVAMLTLQPVVVFQMHWLGMKQIAAETNAAGFMATWNMPETQNIKTQTLNLLAIALSGGSASTNAANSPVPPAQRGTTNLPMAANARLTTNAAPLRPIFDDLVGEESYWEARQKGDKPGELAVAIRLNDSRSGLWLSNLTAVLGATASASSGTNVVYGGRWQLTNWSGTLSGTMPAPRTLELSRAGDWTVIGLSAGTNGVADDFAARIQRDHTPFPKPATNFWLTVDVNPSRADGALALHLGLPEDLPAISFAAIGDGSSIRTHAQLDFPKALPDNLEPWNIPTNIIHDPLLSFTAIRGIGPWLSSLEFWKNLGVGPAPNQIYFWGKGGLPFLCYCAAPISNASGFVSNAAARLEGTNPWLNTNGLGKFERATNFDGVLWNDLTVMTPFLRTASQGNSDFVFGGLETDIKTNRPAPPELLGALFGRTNLVMYDWELTGPRIEHWLYFGQFLRFIVHLAQVPPKSASFAWLMAMSSQLGNSVTVVSRTAPNQLVFGRKSDIGLTAAELDLLADWLESPTFPRGLNTLLGKPANLPKKKPHTLGSQTNSTPVVHSPQSPTNPAPPVHH